MLKVGITGGIGSGKSLVCNIFKQLGIPVYNADERAKAIMLENPVRHQIIETFGPESYLPDGELNRTLLGSTVFNNAEKLADLNAIVHPAVFADFDKWCDAHKPEPYVIKEAAIMFETDSRYTVDTIVLVYAPKALRLERVMTRDGMTETEVLNRMNKQMPDEDKLSLAQHVIYNDGSKMLTEQVLELHKEFMSGKL